MNWENASNSPLRDIVRRAITSLRNILASVAQDAAGTQQSERMQQQNVTTNVSSSDNNNETTTEETVKDDMDFLSNLKLENDITLTDATTTEIITSSSIDTNAMEVVSDHQVDIKYEIKQEKLDDDSDNQEKTNNNDTEQSNNIEMEDINTAGSNADSKDFIQIDPETYCKLGHLHLIMEDFYEGISNILR